MQLSDDVAVGSRTLRNRIVATAHGTAAVVDGMPTDHDVAYWARLARGGPGLVVAGGISVGPTSVPRGRYLGEAWQPHAAAAYRAKAQAITSGGAVALAQLCHLGRETLGAPTFAAFEAPSAVRSPREPALARVLGTEDCRRVVAEFVASAVQMVDAGFDGVELHAAHGYLLAQFLNPRVNLRTDEYGGSPAGRARLVHEVVEGIRAARPDALVALRLSVETDADGADLAEVAAAARAVHERTPVDLLDLTWGNRLAYTPDMAQDRPPLLDEDPEILRELRRDVGVPVLLCSAFRDRADLEAVLGDGRADLVGMARPHLADPDLTLKLLDGRDHDVRPCVSCNEDCRAFDPVVLCTVNPDLAPPGETSRPASPLRVGRPVTAAREVAVVGAGPAGLEAALTLATARGDLRVRLLERGDRLGGQLLAAGAGGTRPGWQRLLAFYAHQLGRAGVQVSYGESATGPIADVTVWATGAVEAPAPGVTSTTAFLLDPGPAPRRVVVLDDGFGWWPSVSAVEAAFARGAEQVSVVTAAPGFAGGVPADSRAQLQRRLRGRRLEVVTGAAATLDGGGGVVVTLNGSDLTRTLPADLVVGTGQRLAQRVPPDVAWAIGDCVAPRRVAHAVAEGRALGRALAHELSTAPTAPTDRRESA